MDMYCSAAARAAEERAAACRERRAELARRHRVDKGAAARAETFLHRAAERATLAEYRLRQLRSRVQARNLAAAASAEDAADSAPLRARLRGVPLAQLHVAYRSIGGWYSELELDAFVYGALEWPHRERQILAHAAWELSEFPG